jgi:hypothetical protein
MGVTTPYTCNGSVAWLSRHHANLIGFETLMPRKYAFVKPMFATRVRVDDRWRAARGTTAAYVYVAAPPWRVARPTGATAPYTCAAAPPGEGASASLSPYVAVRPGEGQYSLKCRTPCA